MRDVIDQLEGWWKNGETAALATVVGTFRSAPRQPGASMLVGPHGEAVGSVSGGCVEGAVYELGEQVLPRRPVLQRYGVSDDDAFAVGLTCGGIWTSSWRRSTRRRMRSFGGRGGGAHRVAGGGGHGRRRARGPAGEAAGDLARPGRGCHRLARLDDAIRDDARGLLDRVATRC